MLERTNNNPNQQVNKMTKKKATKKVNESQVVEGIKIEEVEVADPAGTKGEFIIEVTTSEGVRYTGPGREWLVKSPAKAQVYKTWNGADGWVDKTAKAQGECKILKVTRPVS